MLAGLAVVLGGGALLGSGVRITLADQPETGSASASAKESNADASDSPAFQVTVISLLVTPGESSGAQAQDPRLARIKNQLGKLVPKNHGYKLLDVRSDRLSSGQTVTCDLGKNRRAKVTLLDSAESDGKAKLRCELIKEKAKLSVSEVTTPLNQLFFCEHKLEDGSRLLIGVGAR